MSKYLELFRLYKQQSVFAQNIRDAERRLHDIRKMKEEGMLTNNDVLRSELQLTNYQLAYRETSDNIVIISQQLDVALGLDESLLLVPDTTLLENPLPVLSYDYYVTQAYDLYPELRIAQTESNLAEKNVRIIEGDNLPSLSMRLGNTLQRPVPNVSPAQDLYMNSWNVSFVLSYKLSSLYRNKHNISAAKQAVNLYRVQEEKQMQDIRMNVKAALIKHTEALERIEALTSSVAQANENYRIVQNRYFNQLAVLTDLLDAGSVRLDAELQLTAAKASAVYTYYQLLRSSGNL
jgi:outer membrane protein TolC